MRFPKDSAISSGAFTEITDADQVNPALAFRIGRSLIFHSLDFLKAELFGQKHLAFPTLKPRCNRFTKGYHNVCRVLIC